MDTSPNAFISSKVQLGIWTNWSRGRVFGATLTITRDNGNLLIAFTAFFVGVVSSRLYKIACRMIHQWYSTPHPHDALHHQRQAILRNSETPESGLWGFGQLYLAWRRTSKGPLKRILPFFAIALFFIIAFAAASGFSSRISTGVGNEVMLRGDECGIPNRNATAGFANITGVNLLDHYRSKRVNDAENYARQCYSGATKGRASMFDCDRFVIDKLPMTINTKAPCPFDSGVCRSNDSNLILDTGLLDSHVHLGLNAPTNQRVLFRNVFHCAPLRTDGYTSQASVGLRNYTRYNYGQGLVGAGNNLTLLNYTFEAEDLAWQYSKTTENPKGNRGLNYLLVHEHSVSMRGKISKSESGFIPGPDIRVPDGDTNLVFLVGNGVQFDYPTNDLWYRATTPTGPAGNGVVNGSSPEFAMDEAASPMACVERFQYCNPNLPEDRRCGPLTTYYDSALDSGPLFDLTPDQVADDYTGQDATGSRYLWLANFVTSSASTTSTTMQVMGAKILLSQESIMVGFQGAIANNQWQLDVTHWWSTWLASLQLGYISTATGPGDESLMDLLRLPGDDTQVKMCNSQKIRSNDYASFSVFGLCFVFVTGTVIIVTSYLIDPFFDFLERRRHYKEYQNHEWKANGTLYLQRLGFQALRRGTWIPGSFSFIPKTKPGETFSSLILVDSDLEKQKTGFSLARTTTPETLIEQTTTTKEDRQGSWKSHLTKTNTKEPTAKEVS